MKSAIGRLLFWFSVFCFVSVGPLVKGQLAPSDDLQVTTESDGITRIDIIHRVGGAHRFKAPSSSECFILLAGKWAHRPVFFYVNPTNPQGLSEEFIMTTIRAAAKTWNRAISRDAFDLNFPADYNVEFPGSIETNTITFFDFGNYEVIGQVSGFYDSYTFELIGFDMVLNTRFVWGDATLDPNVMDLQNIVTHELGHALGLGDVYDPACSDVTMYGYGAYGETKQRTLEKPDIKALRLLYRPK